MYPDFIFSETSLKLTNIKIRKETSSDHSQITTILDNCFGLNRLNRTVYMYRKSLPIKALSLISCFKEDPIKVVGTISFYRVFVEKTEYFYSRTFVF